jgi:hypothetical protein
MSRKNFLASTIIILSFVFASVTLASDLALYTGPTNDGWISAEACRREADDMINGLQGVFVSISDFSDGEEPQLGEWCIAHTGNGQVDVIITASGTMPSSLYPFPNLEPDGSNVENFVDDGNVLINIADWIGYMSYEGGVRSADNGASGAANIFDIPGLDFGSRVNAMTVNANGKKYLPSLVDFTDDRPWHVEQFAGTDWEVTTFAEADANNADPAVAVNKNTNGIIAAIIQKAWPNPDPPSDDNRGEVVVEFIKNWLTENTDISAGGSGTAVDPGGKLAATWGELKTK